jgi:hypothetical protein
MSSLEKLVQALPPELYNEVLRLTFTASASPRYISGSCKPPSSLQVSRDTRKHFGESYFGNGSVFYIESSIAWRWIAVLAFDHVRLISDIRLSSDTITVPAGVQAEGAAEVADYIEMCWYDRDHPHDVFFATAFHGSNFVARFKLGVSFDDDYSDLGNAVWIGHDEIDELVDQKILSCQERDYR